MLDILQGTLEFLILRTVAWGPQHGFGIAKWIKTVTEGKLDIDDGALYPALHRMEHKGLVAAEWGKTESGRRAKFYSITPLGRSALHEQSSVWTRYVEAVQSVIDESTRRGAKASA